MSMPLNNIIYKVSLKIDVNHSNVKEKLSVCFCFVVLSDFSYYYCF
jgi:hypothetical protein